MLSAATREGLGKSRLLIYCEGPARGKTRVVHCWWWGGIGEAAVAELAIAPLVFRLPASNHQRA